MIIKHYSLASGLLLLDYFYLLLLLFLPFIDTGKGFLWQSQTLSRPSFIFPEARECFPGRKEKAINGWSAQRISYLLYFFSIPTFGLKSRDAKKSRNKK